MRTQWSIVATPGTLFSRGKRLPKGRREATEERSRQARDRSYEHPHDRAIVWLARPGANQAQPRRLALPWRSQGYMNRANALPLARDEGAGEGARG
jgi:hypothetical protein